MNNSGKVALKVLAAADKLKLSQLLNNKKIWDNLTNRIPYPYTVKDAEFFIELVKNDKQQEVSAIYYEGDFCGVISLIFQNDIYENSAELGYWLGVPFWGKGIATDAVKQMTFIGFKKYNLRRIYARIFEYNLASMKVLEKNGYLREGLFRKAIIKNEKVWDEYVYAKLNL